VLLDLANRRFFFFWIEIWPHEFYFVAGLLIMAGLGLFLFTSALGRVWCGYACPQTVWTDLFILVERWIEGDRNARLRLHRSEVGFPQGPAADDESTRLALIALATGGAWVFYFTDAPTLAARSGDRAGASGRLYDHRHPDRHDLALRRLRAEQICIYMCPWPRIQAAMMDEDTITVAYRDWRGEPRGKQRPQAEARPIRGEKLGDCIDCMACVNVCPMGIDIRDGQQLECITCALCIDACDDVMDKIGKPRGLIDYMALTDEARTRAARREPDLEAHPAPAHDPLHRAVVAGGDRPVVALVHPARISILTVAPVRNPTFVTMSDGSIRNTYDVRPAQQAGGPDAGPDARSERGIDRAGGGQRRALAAASDGPGAGRHRVPAQHHLRNPGVGGRAWPPPSNMHGQAPARPAARPRPRSIWPSCRRTRH
jgi:cytochrome c oxidase accessory protein FixG